MSKFLVVGTLAVLGASLLATGAEAGSSASAPSKQINAKVVTAQQVRTNRQAQNFGITEFSSSSARTSSQRH